MVSLSDLMAMRQAAKLALLKLPPEELKAHLDKMHEELNCPVRNNINATYGSMGSYGPGNLRFNDHKYCTIMQLIPADPQKFYFFVTGEQVHIPSALHQIELFKNVIREHVPNAEFVVATVVHRVIDLNCSDVGFTVTTDGFKIIKARGFQDKVGCYIAF